MTLLSNSLIITLYVITSVAGLVFLKLSQGRIFSTAGMSGASLYGIGFLMWYWILTRVPLSIAFPIAAGGLAVGTQIAGHFVLKESLTYTHLAGVLLIVAGISFVALSKT